MMVTREGIIDCGNAESREEGKEERTTTANNRLREMIFRFAERNLDTVG